MVSDLKNPCQKTEVGNALANWKTQCAFVQGRQEALIANEVVNWLKRNKRSGVFMKLDIQKAYNTTNGTS